MRARKNTMRSPRTTKQQHIDRLTSEVNRLNNEIEGYRLRIGTMAHMLLDGGLRTEIEEIVQAQLSSVNIGIL